MNEIHGDPLTRIETILKTFLGDDGQGGTFGTFRRATERRLEDLESANLRAAQSTGATVVQVIMLLLLAGTLVVSLLALQSSKSQSPVPAHQTAPTSERRT
jgi:hypothetical protein